MWEYYDKNICSDRRVASFVNDKGFHVLDVYESRTSFYTVPVLDIIKQTHVTYEEVSKSVKKGENEDSNETLKKRLIAACKVIEKNYNEQVANIQNCI